MSKQEDMPGIKFNEETSRIVLNHQELDEASQKTLNNLLAKIREQEAIESANVSDAC